jgi:putative protease
MAPRTVAERLLENDLRSGILTLRAILQAGIGTIAIDARERPPAYILAMVRIYRDALQAIGTGGTILPARLEELRNEARKIALGSITGGHFTRGLTED